MVDIIPAVLPKSFAELERGLERLKGAAPLVQIDLVGENILLGHEAMPLWEEYDFEFDIMLPHPERAIATVLAMGASRVVVHAPGDGAREALGMLQETRGGDYAVAVGVALRAHDAPEALGQFGGLYDYVQVMGIEHEGRQGEPPDPHHRELELLRALRRMHPELFLQVDGASAAHPRELAQAGANRLIVGSAILAADDPKAALEALSREANRA